MSTTDKPTDTPTNPADLLPAQIADALCNLARRDQVSIHIDTHKGQPARFHVMETRPIPDSAFEHEVRSGMAASYAEALAACRAAEFGNGGGK